ncbi:hypothetical protein ACIGXM_10960 [Kitasatospora sp. NPDC052896]|uniref:hypothetical protein n=1 Tax=Kitasatospora sp. NPDC052896 TaxID=3364061 RepID=UPI0037C7BB4C
MRSFVLASVLTAAALAAAVSTVSPPARASVPAQRPTAADPGSLGLRLVDIPADLSKDSRARQYVIDNLTPGTTVHRRVEVSNTTAAPLHVDLYPDAASITHGSFVGAPGRTESELTSWTTLDHDSVDVAPGAVVRDTLTIAVPKDAAPGERYAVIWAQASGRHDGGSIALVSRAGIRVYLSVGGDNPPAPKFTVDTMTAQRDPDGHAIVQAQVHNIGGRALDLNGTMKLSAVSGSLSAGPYQVQLGTSLAPEQSEPVKVPVTDQLADGPWNATIELKSGLLAETYQARITFPHESGVAPAAVAHPVTLSAHPLLVGALVVLTLLLGAALLVVVVNRRRRSGSRGPEVQPGTL